MKIPRYTATTPPPRTSGLARATDIGALTTTGDFLLAKDIERFGSSISGVAEYALRGTLMEAGTELSEFKMYAEDQMNQLALSFNENTDASTYDKEYENAISKIRVRMPKNRRAFRESVLWLNTQMPRWKDGIEGAKYERRKDAYRANNFLLQQNAIRSSEFNAGVNMGIYQAHLWAGVKLGAFSKEEEEKQIQQTISARERYEINESARIKAASEEEYKAYVEGVEQKWFDMLRNKDLANLETEIMNSALEVDKKQEWIGYVDKLRDEILSGADIITDIEVKGSLRQMALGISSGRYSLFDRKDASGNTVKGFLSHLKTARYDDKTIDDAAQDEVLNIAQRAHKTHQDSSQADREYWAKGQLVYPPDEKTAADIINEFDTKKERQEFINERVLQLDNWDRYSKELDDLIEEHPEWVDDDIYKASRQLMLKFRPGRTKLRAGLKELSKPTETSEKSAYNMIYDVWDLLPKNVQEAIKLRRQMGESYQKIIDYDEISAAISGGTK